MSDPQGAGYNVLQATIAISSGGVLGKGFLEGTQTQLRFIPAQWTDFIFCVIAEVVWVHWSFSSDSTFCNIDSAVDMGYFFN